MRRSANGLSRLTRMLPRHGLVLTGFALAPGTRRSLDAAAGNIGRHGVMSWFCRYMDGEFWLVTAEKDQ